MKIKITLTVRHKLKVGDTTYISDEDSRFLKERVQDFEKLELTVRSVNGRFKARLIQDKKLPFEINIIEKLIDESLPKLNLVLGITTPSAFSRTLESLTELGINQIIPVKTDYTNISLKKARKLTGKWRAIIREAELQSQNITPPQLTPAISINELAQINLLQNQNKRYYLTSLEENLSIYDVNEAGDCIVAIGPEKGWSASDVKIMENLKFEGIQLKGNVLKAETAVIAASSIIKFINQEF